jgi:hypothetical protein
MSMNVPQAPPAIIDALRGVGVLNPSSVEACVAYIKMLRAHHDKFQAALIQISEYALPDPATDLEGNFDDLQELARTALAGTEG